MSLGEEVVWLTTRNHGHDRRGRGAPSTAWSMDRRGDRGNTAAWLAAGHRQDSSPHSSYPFGRKLKQYGEWLHSNRDRPIIENGVGRANDDGELYSVKHLIQNLSPNALRAWWVYLGRIPPSMIEGLPSE